MDDYIKRDTARRIIESPRNREQMIAMLDAVPSENVQPVRKGCFIGTEYDGYADGSPVFYEWKCSECGCVFEDGEPTYNYCPNCGADMRGEQDG